MVDQIVPLLISIRDQIARLNAEMAALQKAMKEGTERPTK